MFCTMLALMIWTLNFTSDSLHEMSPIPYFYLVFIIWNVSESVTRGGFASTGIHYMKCLRVSDWWWFCVNWLLRIWSLVWFLTCIIGLCHVLFLKWNVWVGAWWCFSAMLALMFWTPDFTVYSLLECLSRWVAVFLHNAGIKELVHWFYCVFLTWIVWVSEWCFFFSQCQHSWSGPLILPCIPYMKCQSWWAVVSLWMLEFYNLVIFKVISSTHSWQYALMTVCTHDSTHSWQLYSAASPAPWPAIPLRHLSWHWAN